jgi:hypothetical protein
MKQKSRTGIPPEIPKQQQFPHFKVVLMLAQREISLSLSTAPENPVSTLSLNLVSVIPE